MRLHYYPETDSLYVEFKDGPGVETREVTDGLNVDLDSGGEVVGFDIDHASRPRRCAWSLSTLETEASGAAACNLPCLSVASGRLTSAHRERSGGARTAWVALR